MPKIIDTEPRSKPLAFGAGALIGTLGGLIGLGGAEFRLPVLISLFRFRGREAVILNKATSLVVVATAQPFRASTVPFAAVAASWPIIVNLLAGSLAGAWVGAGWATRLKSETLYRVIAVLLVLIAGMLLFAHDTAAGSPLFTGAALMVAGIIAGFVIGVIASLLGVAGGEFLIPTLVLLFGADIKLAGSLSLAVSLPTMLVGFTRYSMDDSFGHRTQQAVPAGDGSGINRRHLYRWPDAGAGAELSLAADPRRAVVGVGDQSLAARIMGWTASPSPRSRQHHGADRRPIADGITSSRHHHGERASATAASAGACRG